MLWNQSRYEYSQGSGFISQSKAFKCKTSIRHDKERRRERKKHNERHKNTRRSLHSKDRHRPGLDSRAKLSSHNHYSQPPWCSVSIETTWWLCWILIQKGGCEQFNRRSVCKAHVLFSLVAADIQRLTAGGEAEVKAASISSHRLKREAQQASPAAAN